MRKFNVKIVFAKAVLLLMVLPISQPSYSAISEELSAVLRVLYANRAEDPDGDDDGDGLINSLEHQMGTDPYNEDSDGDGLTDLQEYLLGTNGTLSDTDGDGLLDEEEYYIGTDPLVVGDLDGDGAADGQDNCLDFPNADQADSNGDGIGDACQCGDVTGDGALTSADTTAMGNLSSLELDQLSRCDVSGDSVCNSEDKDLLVAHLASPVQNKIRKACPIQAEIYDKALSRLGYGPDAWSRARIRELGISGYINEQLDPNSIDDSEFAPFLAPYADDANYPTLGKGSVWLKSHYCFSASNKACYERLDSPYRVYGNQSEMKFLRSVYSKRQLHYVLLDVWFNHFNVYSGADESLWTLPRYEAEIESHMYGQFYDMVKAVTLEPSMMDYLNLRTSKKPTPNENYARELMELHTVGPENYLDSLVNEVAKVLSGYSFTSYYDKVQLGTPPVFDDQGMFQPGTFKSGRHVNGPKTLTFDSNTSYEFAVDQGNSNAANATCDNMEAIEGENESLVFLCLLSKHGGTAEMVAEKFIQRFLGDHAFEDAAPDDPTKTVAESLVNLSQFVWLISNGNLKSAVQMVLMAQPNTANADELGSYFQRSLYLEDNRVKRPLLFSASLVRALGPGSEGVSTYQMLYGSGSPDEAASFNGIMGDMQALGEPLYRCGPPTGYSDATRDWIGNSGYFVKMNQVSRLVDRIGDPITAYGLYGGLSDQQIVTKLANRFLPGGLIDDESKQAITTYLQDGYFGSTDNKIKEAMKLILGSPRFFSQ